MLQLTVCGQCSAAVRGSWTVRLNAAHAFVDTAMVAARTVKDVLHEPRVIVTERIIIAMLRGLRCCDNSSSRGDCGQRSGVGDGLTD